jgi:hypothetical protein
MPNRWIEHVRAFAAKNKMSYMCAMSDPDIKKGYIPTERKKQKTEKLEHAMPSTEPKPKSLVIKPRAVAVVKPMLQDELKQNYFTADDGKKIKFNKQTGVTTLLRLK